MPRWFCTHSTNIEPSVYQMAHLPEHKGRLFELLDHGRNRGEKSPLSCSSPSNHDWYPEVMVHWWEGFYLLLHQRNYRFTTLPGEISPHGLSCSSVLACSCNLSSWNAFSMFWGSESSHWKSFLTVPPPRELSPLWAPITFTGEPLVWNWSTVFCVLLVVYFQLYVFWSLVKM